MSSSVSLPASCHFICRSKRTYCSTLKSNYSQTNHSHTLIYRKERTQSLVLSIAHMFLACALYSSPTSSQCLTNTSNDQKRIKLVRVCFCKYSNVQYATRIRTSNYNRGVQLLNKHAKFSTFLFWDYLLNRYNRGTKICYTQDLRPSARRRAA